MQATEDTQNTNDEEEKEVNNDEAEDNLENVRSGDIIENKSVKDKNSKENSRHSSAGSKKSENK